MTALRIAPLAASVIVATCCGGCASFLPARQAPPEGQIPESFALGDAEGVRTNQWWQEFGSQELDALMQEALTENLSLRQLWARLDQAGSTTVKAASGLYPELTVNGDASYSRTVTTVEGEPSPSLKSQLGSAVISGVSKGIRSGLSGGTDSSGGTSGGISVGGGGGSTGQSSPSRLVRETKSFGLSLAASYELDIWGRVASGYRAARFDFEASRDDLESTAMTLAAEVVQRWLTIIEQRQLKKILDEQLETNKTYLELVELRFRKSLVSALDVYQQRQTVSDVQRQIPLIEAQEQVLRHDVAVLLGKPPTASLTLGTYDLETVPAFPLTGVPAELLRNRPDVRAAFARLQAADYRVAAARADRLPAIRLSGGVGYSADDIANVFDDWFVNLAGGLTAPLFDGRSRQAEVDRTLAVVEERLADYRLTVLTAIKEVEDAIVQERKQAEYIDALTRQLADARNALREASQRYRKGLSDYLPVLAALERTQSLTRGLVTARRDLLILRVNLYRALGGTWTEQLEPAPRLSDRSAAAKAVNG
ncbi:MAG TPA: efflux transporter outer membrane subunit [Phycisphaerae bacterium]|nr:efflux transporter outer membrane subunit [Phycisphaerae bacterium]